jgi:hypothetical protein
MKLLKTIKLLFAAAAISVAAGSANATTHNGNSTLIFNGGNAVFGTTFAKDSGFTAFDDMFTFNVPVLSSGSTGASVIAGFSFPAGWNTVFTFFDLYKVAPGPDALIQMGSLGFGGLAGAVGANNLASGDYYFRVQGNVVGNGGSYSGNANLTVTAVPEPGEWALMLSGFGLIALMVRRRTANAS